MSGAAKNEASSQTGWPGSPARESRAGCACHIQSPSIRADANFDPLSRHCFDHPRVCSGKSKAKTRTTVTEKSVRNYMEALAGDAMQGRGSASADELAAANYIAAQLKLLKITPAGDNGTFLQTAKFMRRVRGAPNQAPTEATTTNVVGILRGRDRNLAKETILLSAHLDHLGIGREVNGDKIYNGADDDASGVTAVLELAMALTTGPRPKRTVVFALFGSEEIGGHGARIFSGASAGSGREFCGQPGV